MKRREIDAETRAAYKQWKAGAEFQPLVHKSGLTRHELGSRFDQLAKEEGSSFMGRRAEGAGGVPLRVRRDGRRANKVPPSSGIPLAAGSGGPEDPRWKKLRHHAREAVKPTNAELLNLVLYRMCAEHPAHRTPEEILAKLMIIGRTYSAALERGKRLDWDGEVVPILRRSKIDEWIAEAGACAPGSADALAVSIRTHGNLTALFEKISDKQKRSLASKYLHFHAPGAFFIFDSRAADGMRKVVPLIGIAAPARASGDRVYNEFAAGCAHLRDVCAEKFRVTLDPRQVDNLLLRVAEDSAF